MAIERFNLKEVAAKPLPKGKKTFNFKAGEPELKKWQAYVTKNGGQVLNIGDGLYRAKMYGVVVGEWNPFSKSAFVNFDMAMRGSGGNTFTPD
jgi:hypothetical protein